MKAILALSALAAGAAATLDADTYDNYPPPVFSLGPPSVTFRPGSGDSSSDNTLILHPPFPTGTPVPEDPKPDLPTKTTLIPHPPYPTKTKTKSKWTTSTISTSTTTDGTVITTVITTVCPITETESESETPTPAEPTPLPPVTTTTKSKHWPHPPPPPVSTSSAEEETPTPTPTDVPVETTTLATKTTKSVGTVTNVPVLPTTSSVVDVPVTAGAGTAVNKVGLVAALVGVLAAVLL